MKSLGIVRRIDDLGRIVLPKELRRTFKINEGDPLEIFVNQDTICIKPYAENACVFCGETEPSDLIKNGDKFVCHHCIGILSCIGEQQKGV